MAESNVLTPARLREIADYASGRAYRHPGSTTEREDLNALLAHTQALAKALQPFAFETSPDVRFIWTHNPETLAGDHTHASADFKDLCVLVIADPTWVSHTAVPDFHHAVKNARDALGLSRACGPEDK